MTVTQQIKEYYNLINGEMVTASSGETFDSIDPSTGKPFAKIPKCSKTDADEAVMAAHKAFPEWANLSSLERGEYLFQAGQRLTKHAEELALLEAQGNGWVIRETSYGLIPVLKQVWFDAASMTKASGQGETTQMGVGNVGFTLREPYGVVLGITPWNAPLFTFTIKAAHALAAGNTVVIKPSKEAAVSSLRYAEILNEVLPPGVLNVVSGSGSELGDYLVSHEDIDVVSLTGSGGTAQSIAKATSHKPKPLILELGGKSPNIVFEDADLEKAINGITIGGIFTGNAGQICVGGSRILIQRSIYEETLALMKQRMEDKSLNKIGNALSPESSMGPIATASQFKKVCSYIELGKEEGGEVVFGGRYGGNELLPDQPELANGYYVEPTLLKVPSNALRVCQEEIFGPVAVAIPFDTEEDAIRIANDTTYGLAAGVWTQDLDRAHRLIRKIQAGNVWINTYARVGAELPFGGVKESGFGVDSALAYSREKACVIDIS